MIAFILYIPAALYLIYYALKNPRKNILDIKQSKKEQTKTVKQTKQEQTITKNSRKIELLRMQSKQLKIQRARILEKYKTLELEYIDAGKKRQLAIEKELEKLDDKIYKIDFQRAKLYNEYLNITEAA